MKINGKIVITIQIWFDFTRFEVDFAVCTEIPVCRELISPEVHTEKSFRNIIKSNRNQIVFTKSIGKLQVQSDFGLI